MDWTLKTRPVWRILVVAFLSFLALVAWAISSPPGSSPDDDFHLTSIWCAQGERVGLCENISADSVDVPNDVVHAPCFAYHKEVSAKCQANLDSSMFKMGRSNNLEHSYPGGFYWVMSWFATPNVQHSILLMRLFNAALFVAMSTSTFLLIERRWRGPLALGIALTVVPLGMSIIPSTNPSSWTLYAPALLYLLTRSLLRSTIRSKSIMMSILIIAIAAISGAARSDAALFSVFAIGLAAISEWGAWFKRLAFYLISAAAGFVALLSLISGRQASSAAGGLNGESAELSRSSLSLFIRNLVDLPGLILGSAGNWNLGWLDTPMPSSVWVLMLASISTVLIGSISRKRRLSELNVPLIAAFLLFAVPMAITQFSGAPIGAFVQPRYVLPLLALTVISILSTNTAFEIDTNGRQLKIVICLIGLANLISLATNTIRYSSGLLTSSISNLSDYFAPLLLGLVTTSLIAAVGMKAVSNSMK